MLRVESGSRFRRPNQDRMDRHMSHPNRQSDRQLRHDGPGREAITAATPFMDGYALPALAQRRVAMRITHRLSIPINRNNIGTSARTGGRKISLVVSMFIQGLSSTYTIGPGNARKSVKRDQAPAPIQSTSRRESSSTLAPEVSRRWVAAARRGSLRYDWQAASEG
jgi:hypothetical protein